MRQKKEKTEDEIAARKEEVRLNRVKRSLITKVKKDCAEAGVRSVRMKLEYINEHPTTKLPTELGLIETTECYETGIKLFQEEI